MNSTVDLSLLGSAKILEGLLYVSTTMNSVMSSPILIDCIISNHLTK